MPEWALNAGTSQTSCLQLACSSLQMAAVVDLPAQPTYPVAISFAFQGMASSISPQQWSASADAFEVKAASSSACGNLAPVQPDQQASKRPGSSGAQSSSSPIIFLGAPQCTCANHSLAEASLLHSPHDKETDSQAEPGIARHPAVSQKSFDMQLPYVAIDLNLEVCLPLAMFIQEFRGRQSSAPQSSKGPTPEHPSSPDGKSSHAAVLESSKSQRSRAVMMSLRVFSVTGQLLHGPAIEHTAQKDGSTSSATGLAFWANHLELNMQTSTVEVRITIPT